MPGLSPALTDLCEKRGGNLSPAQEFFWGGMAGALSDIVNGQAWSRLMSLREVDHLARRRFISCNNRSASGFGAPPSARHRAKSASASGCLPNANHATPR